ncbi:MAG: sialate O-acetylesterase [Fuerstiella sp.]|nr:sialate O-acetylesterase [Fuerstiella sp.]
MSKLILPLIVSSLALTANVQGEEAFHLFILSGQSNMAGLDPDESFTPAVQNAFGTENVIVVKDAVGGQPIRRWYKDWKPSNGDAPKGNGDLYDRLMAKVTQATKDKQLASVTFLWMQGERDANEKHGDVYEASLKGLFDQLQKDLQRDDINVVIGRLSDFDMKNQRYAHWTMVRDIQVKVAEGHPRGAWVDTDDLNDGLNRKGKPIMNDLQYSGAGYKTVGKRLADKAIQLIGKIE